MAKVRLLLDMPQSSAQLLAKLGAQGFRYEQLQELSSLLAGLALGTDAARANVQIGSEDGASSTGTLTVSGSGASSASINGQALTGGTHYAISGLTAAQIATNLAEAIRNSQSSKVQAVLAEASGAVVTVTAKEAGLVGDLIALAGTGTVAASASTLASGAEPTQRSYAFNMKS